MFPFWEKVIAPVLEAADAKRIVEIGALRGDTTALMLEGLGPDAQLHVIDPLPQFDPSEHEKRFQGRYIFHRTTSHAALPGIEAMDAALIDGDHNWHTVHRELELLAEASAKAGEMLPVMFMHDVLWPYGRRDLYYVPSRIPEAERQPFLREGIERGRDELQGEGGINASLANATHEGGPRNGVMTALDDFVAEHPEPLRIIVLPIYFGLAIIAEERRLRDSPALAAAFERLESPELLRQMLELAEELRLEAVISEHETVFKWRSRLDRSANRYLRSVRASLLDDQNIENEARLAYLADCSAAARRPEQARLRDPALHMSASLRAIEQARITGDEPHGSRSPSPFFPYASSGREGLDGLQRCLHTIRNESVAGDFADCGTGRGGEAIYMRAYLDAYELPHRAVWVLDEFRSPEAPDPDPVQANRMADLNMVRKGFSRFALLDDRVRFLSGPVASRISDPPFEKLALLRIDGGRCGSLATVLDRGYERLSSGGFIVVDGCGDPQVRAELEDWRSKGEIDEQVLLENGRALWRKIAPAKSAAAETTPADREYPAAIEPEPSDPCELSLVVVVHNMRREAERTLRSLSRNYQQGIDQLDYEVIVVENGSTPDLHIDREMVESFGPEFRFLDLGEESTPSPATALNRGIELARGEVVGMMIDGAHVLSPGVLRYAMQASASHRPAMVATQQWYVGPGQQVETVGEGYDRDYEDSLFEQIEWPRDGYRLFEVSHFIGARDWLDGMWESNCLFVPRSVLAQVGAFDERFSMPASGLANLDIYERVGAAPDVQLVTILGEGSFHQIHGGTTTNAVDREARERLLASYRAHYEELHGRPFRPLDKPFHYVGSISQHALRTRARRMGAKAFLHTAGELAADRLPELPMPMPEDLQREFTDAYWHSKRWRTTSWLGRAVAMAPVDLLAYQQLISEGRPRWIIETGRNSGGRAQYLASICDLVGEGEVISIGRKSEDQEAELPQHPRITYVEGNAGDPQVFEQVSSLIGGEAEALVIIGRDERNAVIEAFRLYSEMVPVGSWVVIEDTITNGHPVWPGMGQGPAEAVSVLRRSHPDFEPDLRMERLTPSFNPGGYLRRTANGTAPDG